MGFAGSGTSRTVSLLAGVAGLLAGSFSMAAGDGHRYAPRPEFCVASRAAA
jgi:hypothetical protein